MSEYEKLKDQALGLLTPFENRFYPTLSDVHWVTNDGHDLEGDFCENCIDQAVKNAEIEYKESKQKIIDKFTEIETKGTFNGKIIEEKFTEKQLKKAKKHELKELGKNDFSSTFNYGGGYEAEQFLTCNICEKDLDISILPSKDEIEYLNESLQDGSIDDQTAYRAYCLIYNGWNENDEKHSETIEPIKNLCKRIIEILSA